MFLTFGLEPENNFNDFLNLTRAKCNHTVYPRERAAPEMLPHAPAHTRQGQGLREFSKQT